MDYELGLGIPPGWVNYSISKTAPDGFWHRLETGSVPMDADFFAGFNRDLHDQVRWETFYKLQQTRNPALPKDVPSIPKIDGERLFHSMMYASRHPDPWMFPALKNLKSSGKYLLAALSNTVIFPPGHDWHREDFLDDPVRGIFDVFISSAHVGLRKPDPRIYQLAVEEVDRYARAHSDDERGKDCGWKTGIVAEDILFLDDIGENLRTAKKAGFKTIKVHLGRAFEAVEELESITGLKLAGNHPKIPVKPNLSGTMAKM